MLRWTSGHIMQTKLYIYNLVYLFIATKVNNTNYLFLLHLFFWMLDFFGITLPT